MLVAIIIGEIGNLSDQVARQRAQQVVAGIKLMKPYELVDFVIYGYDNDSREVWDIPETRDYFITFYEELVRYNVLRERILPQTLDTIRACYAIRIGRRVVSAGTKEDTARIGAEQVMEHIRMNRH